MEYIGLALFLVQQLGMTLGVGASTFAITFYLSALRDGTVDPSERRFLKMTYAVLRVGLGAIIVSGALITAAHVLAGQQTVVFEPAFLFKWMLIGLIVMNGILMSLHLLPALIGGPFAGATWYALFFVHNTAPDLSLPVVAILYGFWVAIFMLLFHAIRLTMSSPAEPQLIVQPRMQEQPQRQVERKEPRPVSQIPQPVPQPLRTPQPQKPADPARITSLPQIPKVAVPPVPSRPQPVPPKPTSPVEIAKAAPASSVVLTTRQTVSETPVQKTPAPAPSQNIPRPLTPPAPSPRPAVPMPMAKPVPPVAPSPRPQPQMPASTPSTPSRPPITSMMPKAGPQPSAIQMPQKPVFQTQPAASLVQPVPAQQQKPLSQPPANLPTAQSAAVPKSPDIPFPLNKTS